MKWNKYSWILMLIVVVLSIIYHSHQKLSRFLTHTGSVGQCEKNKMWLVQSCNKNYLTMWFRPNIMSNQFLSTFRLCMKTLGIEDPYRHRENFKSKQYLITSFKLKELQTCGKWFYLNMSWCNYRVAWKQSISPCMTVVLMVNKCTAA